jgi:hypothetical protein
LSSTWRHHRFVDEFHLACLLFEEPFVGLWSIAAASETEREFRVSKSHAGALRLQEPGSQLFARSRTSPVAASLTEQGLPKKGAGNETVSERS